MTNTPLTHTFVTAADVRLEAVQYVMEEINAEAERKGFGPTHLEAVEQADGNPKYHGGEPIYKWTLTTAPLGDRHAPKIQQRPKL